MNMWSTGGIEYRHSGGRAAPGTGRAEPRGSTVSLTNLLMCAALSLLLGLGGAWIYHTFLEETTVPDRPEQDVDLTSVNSQLLPSAIGHGV